MPVWSRLRDPQGLSAGRPGAWSLLRSRRARRPLALAASAAVVITALVVTGGDDLPPVPVRELQVPGTPEVGRGPIVLDASLYLPARTPAPAVLLAHGFGGSKDDLAGDARLLARRGYVVLAYTARGFGRSGGLVHLNSPQFEVADARRMLDALAARPEVRLDRAGDPVVGVAGESYGGALALLLAGGDPRVDAIAPRLAWNDLRQALFPQFGVADSPQPATPAEVRPATGPGSGVFKQLWAATFFGGALAAGAAVQLPGAEVGGNPACGRFDLALCELYSRVASGAQPTAADLALLARSSPASVLDRITAPTLLVQGQQDSLFPLSEADAIARGIAARGTELTMIWTTGGHDGGPAYRPWLLDHTASWFDQHLPGRADRDRTDGGRTDTRGFEVVVPDAVVSSADTNPAAQVRVARSYPGLPGSAPMPTIRLPLSAAGPARPVLAPPGGLPAGISTLPGLGGALDLAGALGGAGAGSQTGSDGAGGAGPGGAGADGGAASAGASGLGAGGLPGQTVTFDTAPLTAPLTLIGSGRVQLRVAGTAPDAVLFASLLDVSPQGVARRPAQLVTPVRVTRPGPAGRVVTLALPAVVHDVPVGHRLRVAITTTDQGYRLPDDPRFYAISAAPGAQLVLPRVPMTAVVDSSARTLWTVAAGMALLLGLAALVFAVRGRRRRVRHPDPELAAVPLALTGLGKVYGGGFRAVTDLSFQVRPGMVLGLLGPNGAGKTTALRMVVGLIRPTEGEIRIFGYPVDPGAPVLSRVGAFIEGPGFLPHLSGWENLRLYWRATGRPERDAHLEEALEVAGLGPDVHRRVRTYSQGMRQRLAIAQAMLGLPELLVLDEPTNGLDPPQIREMRQVLARYAATGRTVVVSSHLLSEVEQTCTDVVVMHRGKLVAQGPVAQIAAAATVVAVDVDDPLRAVQVAEACAGVQDVTMTSSGLVVRVARAERAGLVRALVQEGLEVERVAPQRGLEEAFLALVGEDAGQADPAAGDGVTGGTAELVREG